jgi:hypothetical protein
MVSVGMVSVGMGEESRWDGRREPLGWKKRVVREPPQEDGARAVVALGMAGMAGQARQDRDRDLGDALGLV